MTQNQKIDNIVSEFLCFRTYPSSYTSNTMTNRDIFWSEILSNPNLEVPLIISASGVIRKSYDLNNQDGYTTTVLPFNDLSWSYASVKTGFTKFGAYKTVTKLHIKDECFYVGNGIIMNKDKEILFIVTRLHRIEERREDAIINIYFNPKVFKKDNTINKFIVDSLFPIFIEYKTQPLIHHTGHINIIIDDYKGFYSIPLKGNPLDTNKMAYEILDEYLESVCATIIQ